MAVVLITGCSSGIGKYTALEMARRGHRVFASMRNLESARFLRADARKAQLALEILQLDVTDQGSVTSAVQQVVKQAGAIDVLVNNAGIGSVGVVEDYTDQEIRQFPNPRRVKFALSQTHYARLGRSDQRSAVRKAGSPAPAHTSHLSAGRRPRDSQIGSGCCGIRRPESSLPDRQRRSAFDEARQRGIRGAGAAKNAGVSEPLHFLGLPRSPATACSGRFFYRREFSRRTRQKAQADQAVAEHEGEVRGEAVGEYSRRACVAGEEQQPRSLTSPQMGNCDR